MPRKTTEYIWVVTVDGELMSVHKTEAGAVGRANSYLATTGRMPVSKATGTMWLCDSGGETDSIMVQRHELFA